MGAKQKSCRSRECVAFDTERSWTASFCHDAQRSRQWYVSLNQGAVHEATGVICLIGCGAVAWPSVVQAQQQKRRLAVIQGGLLPGDPDGQREVAAFERGLNALGWKPGTNIDIDYYWPGAEIGSIRDATGEAARTRPDVVISRSTPATAAIMGTGLPIIFLVVADPIAPEFVQSISKPGHNVTGFANL